MPFEDVVVRTRGWPCFGGPPVGVCKKIKDINDDTHSLVSSEVMCVIRREKEKEREHSITAVILWRELNHLHNQ